MGKSIPASRDRRKLPMWHTGEVQLAQRVTPYQENLEAETVWEPHSHPTHELLWNERGMSMATVGEKTWAISPTVALWIPAGTVHTGYAPEGTCYRTLHFDALAFGALSPGPIAMAMSQLLRLLVERLETQELGKESRRKAEDMIFDVLTPIDDALVVQRPAGPLLGRIADAVIADPGNAQTLHAWSRELEVSERTISRAFIAETGLGFSEWVAAVRAQRAMLLLAANMSVEEVAERMGYSSASAFGSAFRRTTGVTPGRVRTG